MKRLKQLGYAVWFVAWLGSEVIRQAWKIAVDVLTPGLSISPSIIEFPLRARTPLEIAAIESAITITPGTLTLGIAEADDEQHTKSLFVHFLYAHTHEGAIAELEDMESRLLRATRAGGRGQP